MDFAVSKRTLAFAPMWNTKKADATGAFQPEAKRFLERHVLPKENLILIDNKQSAVAMREQVLDALASPRDGSCLDVGIAFFCHGYKSGIQFGFTNSNVKTLASVMAVYGGSSVIAPLYACDTGRDADRDRTDDLSGIGGDGGFADMLRDALCEYGSVGCVVDAHTTAGHTTRNPYVRRFEGQIGGGMGGYYLVAPRSKLWSKWRAALKTPYRFDFPFQTVGEIHYDLDKL
jgi:hypothetical protein